MSKVDFKGSVVLNPVPVVMITSRNLEGMDNVFTVAWAGTICTKPPMLSISVRPERLSYEYIKETGVFTVNMPSRNLVKEVDYCGVKPGRKFDKIKDMNFTMKEGTHINVPYIDECPVSIECKVKEFIPLGTHDLIIAEVLGSHIDEDIIDEKGKIHFEEANLITYCHGEYYPMSKKAIGSFGFSVAKKNIEKKKLASNATNNKQSKVKSSIKNNKKKKSRR